MGDAHAVIVSLTIRGPRSGDAGQLDLFGLGEKLESALQSASAGALDGEEFGTTEANYYLYGPDADLLFDAVKSVLGELDAPPGSYVKKRYGPPGAPEQRFVLPL